MKSIRLTVFTWISVLFTVSIAPVQAVDFYVSPVGHDTTGYGLEEATPFRSISFALFVADTTEGRPHNIHVDAGIYMNLTENFPLPVIDQTTISGAGPGMTIIDAAESYANAFFAVFNSDWTIENLTVRHGVAIEGGGISVYQGENGTLRNLTIENNRADFPLFPNTQGRGGGIMLYETENMLVEHVLFQGNSAYDYGGALAVVRCSPLINHVTVVWNQADENPESSALYFEGGQDDLLTIENSIIWGNPNVFSPDLSIAVTPDAELALNYSLVENADDTPWEGENVNADPLFMDPVDDFHVLVGSPSIDIGNPESPFDNEPEPNGNLADAGVYGNTDEAQISGAVYSLRRNTWAFIGSPLLPPNSDLEQIFVDDLGEELPGDSTWRLQRWDADQGLFLRLDESEDNGEELGDPPPLDPGTGYMVHQNMTNRIPLHVEGYALPQDEPLIIPIPAGDGVRHHMLANPFPYNINLVDTRLITPTGEIGLDEAAAEGYISRFVQSVMGNNEFQPVLGTIIPWQGVVITTFANDPLSWKIYPERHPEESPDFFEELDWGLTAGFVFLDDVGDPIHGAGNRIFGTRDGSETALDPYDALKLDWTDSDITFDLVSEEHPPMLADIREPLSPGDLHSWHVQIRYTIPDWREEVTVNDSIEFSIDGFLTMENDGEVYPPDENIWFWMTNSQNTIIEDSLRYYPIVRLPVEIVDETRRFVEFWINAGNSVPLPPEAAMEVSLQPQFNNLRSSWVVPENLDAESVFSSIEDLVIVLRDDGGTYIPPGLNTIGDLDLTEAYRIFTNSETTWRLSGDMVDPEQQYSVSGDQWNWISFPFDWPFSTETALAEIADDIAIVMSDQGEFYIPGLLDFMPYMQPGKGYFLFANEDLTFQYNTVPPVLRTAPIVRRELLEPENPVTPTGQPYVILVEIPDSIERSHPISVEILDDGIRVGAGAFIDDLDVQPVIAWQADTRHNLPGFTNGNAITARVIGAGGETLLESDLILDNGTNGYFGNGPYAKGHIGAIGGEAMPERFAVQAAFPNPFNATTVIPYSIPTPGKLRVKVYNVLGRQMLDRTFDVAPGNHSFTLSGDVDFQNSVSGIYFVVFDYNGNSHTQKIIMLK